MAILKIWISTVLKCLALGFVAVTPLLAQSQTSQIEKSFRGIPRIQVLVEELDATTANVFTGSQLTLKIEKILRSAGIPITKESVVDDSERGNYLYLNINALSGSCGVAYAAELKFNQVVLLLDGTREYGATTWKTGYIQIGPSGGFQRGVDEGIERMTKEFALEWLKANR